MCLRSFFCCCTTHFCISIRVHTHCLFYAWFHLFLSLARSFVTNHCFQFAACTCWRNAVFGYVHATHSCIKQFSFMNLLKFHAGFCFKFVLKRLKLNLCRMDFVCDNDSCKCRFHTSFVNIAEYVNIYTMWQ